MGEVLVLAMNLTEETKAFFNQWNLYKQIVDNDYMYHSAITSGVARYLSGVDNLEKMEILDLGCGDCFAAAEMFGEGRPDRYMAVDLSPVALSKAEGNLAGYGFQFGTVEANFTDFVEGLAPERQFDCVITGFTLHHLGEDLLEQFIKSLVPHIRAGGHWVTFDVFRRAEQSRAAYIEEYCHLIRNGWHRLSIESRDGALTHVSTCDFPPVHGEFLSMMLQEGLTLDEGLKFEDTTGIHHLDIFRK